MDADAVIDGIEARLAELVRARPFRFVDTRRADAEAYLARLTAFSGFTEREIADGERGLGKPLPALVNHLPDEKCGRPKDGVRWQLATLADTDR
jgi:hypothetical protein